MYNFSLAEGGIERWEMSSGQERTALVTGCAGFLGSHLCEALLASGRQVRGVDCFTDYYPRARKESNAARLRRAPGFRLFELDLAGDRLGSLLDGVETVFHLGAQPGVRNSFGDGFGAYLRHNVQATQRLLEAAVDRELTAFVYASSSSVYGDQDLYPAREDSPVRPVSPYGATKVITEQLAGAFWRSHGAPVVGMRYFTVYGPRQRPDMAFARFLERAVAGEPLPVFGDGRQVREFTYVDDVVAATIAAAEHGERGAVYNIGGGEPVSVLEAIALLEELLDRPVVVEHREAGPGDPRRTEADVTRAARDLGYRPSTSLEAGLAAQLEWLQRRGDAVGDVRVSERSRPPDGLRGGPTGSLAPGPRVLAYSHDGFGLGHLRRNLRLVCGLRRRRPDVQALLVTGAKSAQRLVAASGIECVPLPAVVKVANGRYVAEDGECSLQDVVRTRAEAIASAVRDFRPDLLLVDRYPRGMHDELVPALRLHSHQRPGAPAVLGLRDILDDPAAIREEWRLGRYSETILRDYAAVLCYGDPSLYDPIREYGIGSDIAKRIHFTGYLADELMAGDAVEVRRRHAGGGGRLAVCTLGGGKDAGPIAQSFLSAMERLRHRGWAGVLITGPYMSSDDLKRLSGHPAASWVSVIPMVEDVPSYLAAADVAVCMGGYNTTCELLALSVPAVIVPRVKPRREQQMRAERLGARGLVRCLHPSEMSASALAEMVERAAAESRVGLAERLESIRRHGIDVSAQRLAALLPAAQPGGALDRRPGGLERLESLRAIG